MPTSGMHISLAFSTNGCALTVLVFRHLQNTVHGYVQPADRFPQYNQSGVQLISFPQLHDLHSISSLFVPPISLHARTTGIEEA